MRTVPAGGRVARPGGLEFDGRMRKAGFTRRFVLAALGGILTLPCAGVAGAPELSPRPRIRGGRDVQKAVRDSIEALVARSRLTGDVACIVADAATGDVLEGHHEDTALPPASVGKILTTLYALDRLGPEFRFRTRLLAAGPVRGGILEGDLILAGGGDPTLDTEALAEMAAGLKAAGLREVRGRFLVYDGALPFIRSIDPSQPPQLGYSPAVSGIALNYNRVHFEWKREGADYNVTMDARTARFRPDVQMVRMAVVDRKAPVYTYSEAERAENWTVARAALGKEGARWLPVRKPALYAGDVFATLARSQGIVLEPAEVIRDLPPGVRLLVKHDSEPLREILRGMLKYSNNLTAEMVGMTATAARGAVPGSLRDSADEMNRWIAARYGAATVRMADHSGLSGESRATVRDLLRVLLAARQRGELTPLLKEIRVRDDRGRRIKDSPLTVKAKTGTLNFVSGLAGFVTTAGGTELAFAILSADLEARARIDPDEGEVPKGVRRWLRRARGLQQRFIRRWGAVSDAS